MSGIAIADWTVMYEDEAETLRGYQRSLFGGTPQEKPEATLPPRRSPMRKTFARRFNHSGQQRHPLSRPPDCAATRRRCVRSAMTSNPLVRRRAWLAGDGH